MEYKYSSVQPIISLKLKRNNLMIDYLKKESELIKYDISIKKNILIKNQERIKLMEKINEIEEKQKEYYSYDNENTVKEFTELFNDLGVRDEDVEYIKNLLSDNIIILQKIKEVESQIPDKIEAYNYIFQY